MTELGIVVLCHGVDAEDGVRPLVTQLLDQGFEAGCLTIVRNPGGEDKPFQSFSREIDVITPPRNVGYAGGMNLGIANQLEKNRELILLLTMDVRPDAGAIASLCKAARDNSTFAILGPELRWTGAHDHMSWGVRWSPTGYVDHVLGKPDDTDHDGIVECDSIDGAVVLMRADVVRQIGTLTDRLFMYFEETEFCLRVKRAGWRVGVVLGAVAEQSSGMARRPGAFNYLMARNGLEFAKLVAGRRGVAAALRRYLMQSWRLLKMRFSPRSDRARQRYATVSLTGLWLGVVAYFRRRWGPPPSNLPGMGDMTFAG
jgi:GT2 family glycosyltransferase